MGDPVRLSPAQIEEAYRQGRVAQEEANKNPFGSPEYEAKADEAMRKYAPAFMSGRAQPTDSFVVNDTSRRAAFNLANLAYERGTARMPKVTSGTEEDRGKAAAEAMGGFVAASIAYDAARTDNTGKPNAAIEAHVNRAGASIARARISTVAGFFPGAFHVNMPPEGLRVGNVQLEQLAIARQALKDAKAQQNNAPPGPDRQAVGQIDTVQQKERLQRIQTFTAITAGAYAALSDSTAGIVAPTITEGTAIAMGDVTAFASQIRDASAHLLKPGPDKEPPKIATRAQWFEAWTKYFDDQVKAPDLQDRESKKLVGEARTVLTQLRGQLESLSSGR